MQSRRVLYQLSYLCLFVSYELHPLPKIQMGVFACLYIKQLETIPTYPERTLYYELMQQHFCHDCITLIYYRLTPREFNSYGARRGNDSVMSRGTFANIRLVNKFMSKPGPKTLHFPSGETHCPLYYTVLPHEAHNTL